MLLSEMQKLADILGIKKPWDIRIKSKPDPSGYAAAYCEQHFRKGEIVKHIITIYIPNMESSHYILDSVIAHEFIHAWQAENNILNPKKYHNDQFVDMAKKLKRKLGIPGIYSKETDTD